METTNSYDYIIVGHGIAGTLLGYFLEKTGQSCYYIDAPQQAAATQVAAGIINPITGRRFVKAWRVADFLPWAKTVYKTIEQEFGISIYHEHPLIRTLVNRGDENNWQARLLDPEYAAYAQEPPDLGNIPAITQPAFSYTQVTNTAQVDIGILCQQLRVRHREESRLLETKLDYEQLELTQEGVKYAEVSAHCMIFCEGWRARHNPWFAYLPHGGNKGEVLEVELLQAQLDRMFKHRLFLVPLANGNYWVGATSENQFDTDQPSQENATYLTDRLNEILTTPFNIVAHRAAVRPTVKDRRPFLGRHPKYQQLAIFNGMGTKGASLAPFWANHFVAHLEKKEPLDDIVNIKRFEELWSNSSIV